MMVSDPALSQYAMTQAAVTLSSRVWALALAALICLGGALLVPDPVGALVLFGTAGALVALVLVIRLLTAGARGTARPTGDAVAEFVARDASPSFTTDGDGQITYQNGAAEARFGEQGGKTMIRAMGDLFANPAAVMFRLQGRAAAGGAAREDVVTRRGHVRLAVHRIAGGSYLWRLEEMMERAVSGRGADSLSLPMLTASKSGTILFMNEAMRRLVGGRVKTLDRVFTTLPLTSGEETAVSTENGLIRALVAEVDGSGGRREIYLLPVSQVQREKPIEQSEFEDLPVALLKISHDGRVEVGNKLARALVGLDPDEDVQLSGLVEGLGRPVADWLADAVAGRTVNRQEVLRAIRPSQETYLQITLRRVLDQGRAGLVAVLNDATQLKTLEAQFVQSQKMQAIGQLAGGVAHDFNNLLTAISGHCDLLLLRHDKGDGDYSDLMQIHQNANRAAALVGQLLAFSRKQTLQPEVVDLRDSLADLGHLLNRLMGEKVTLDLRHGPDLRPILADKRQLEQVIMNLVVNARDAMPDGGTIHLDTECRTLHEALDRDRASVPKGDYVVVRVRDEGIGIPEDKLTKIFEPFFTTKRTGEGTGLGLSTVYGIVKQTGGFIFVDSVLASGSTFTLFFPVYNGPDQPLAVPVTAGGPVPTHLAPVRDLRSLSAAPALRKGEGVVLLVEDEAPVRAFASRALRMRGYTVLEADSAEEALKTLADPGLTVDVFVTDVIMPGMDGPSWVREALKTRPNVKVVFVSGYAEDSFSETKARIPNSVFLPKPFSLSELTATVQGQIH